MRFLIEHLLNQRDRWILWAPVAMAIGVGIYFSLYTEPALWMGGSIFVSLIVLARYFYGNKPVFLLLLIPILMTLGFTAAQWRTEMIAGPLLDSKTFPLRIEGRVVKVDALPKGYRIVLDSLHYNTKRRLPQKNMPEKIRIRLKKNTEAPAAGDRIGVKAILLPLSPPVLPEAFDFQRFAFFKGIGATGFALSELDVIEQKERGYFFSDLRQYLRRHIKGAMESSDAAAITIALLDGEDKDISPKTHEIVRAAGIAHLLAISGMQVTMVTAFFFFLVRMLLASIPYIALRWPVKKITAFIAMGGALFYMGLIGEAVSAQRAVIMVCVVMTAIILDRDPFTLRLAAFAAALLLLFQPESLFGASFQLSFAAVIALIAFYESTRHWWHKILENRRWFQRLGVYIFASMATTLVATLATAPFALFHFLRTPLLPGIIANLVAVPVSSFITMPAAIIGSFLMPLGLETYPLKIAEWSVMVILKTAETVSEWPYTVHRVDGWSIEILIMMCFGGLWICLWQGRMRWAGIVPVLLGLIMISMSLRADVLIAERGKIFAVRDRHDILWLSSARKDKFIRKSWVEREADAGHNYWSKEGAPVSCDDQACLYRHKGHLISFVKEYTALAEDCANADVVVSELYIKRKWCPQPKFLLDRKVLKYKGAHALYFKENGRIFVKTVAMMRGTRPWTRKEKKWEYKKRTAVK